MPARLAKFLVEAMRWRWTPCIALIASSLFYVVLAVAVVPSNISLAPSAKPAGVEPPDPANALTAPRTDRANARRGGAQPPATPPVIPTGAPSPPPDQPAPPSPAERREDPPAPPPAPVPMPVTPPPPPPPAATEDDDQPEPAPAAAPAPPLPGRATPLRFLPQINQPGGAAPPAPQPPPPAE